MKSALITFLCVLILASTSLSQSDADLRSVIEKDRVSRTAEGKLMTLPVNEHVVRGFIYMDNRHFAEAEQHFQKVLDVYAADPLIQRALFGMGRSLMWERKYAEAIPFFERVAREFPSSKDGREGLYFEASCALRIGRNLEAGRLWKRYTETYPLGERIEGAYINAIDAFREGGSDREANVFADTTCRRFPGTPTEMNALHARLRMEINRGNWPDAERTALRMQAQSRFAGSLTSLDEVKYLQGIVLEHQNKLAEALGVYGSIKGSSYYGGLVKDKIAAGKLKAPSAGMRTFIGPVSAVPSAGDFPLAYRDHVLRESKKRGLDPRFILAIMKQESTFRPGVKSGSAARGLLQLVMDTALKYNKKAGFAVLQPDDLYNPATNIAIGTEYIADLKSQFGGLYEAIAASYNGGEDNAARWLSHTKPRDPGIFASEVGFAETKNYVFKVMNNYRAYRDLYDENLARR
jgi:outer membrane protein assembly factor BamD (BamD/ComL family)